MGASVSQLYIALGDEVDTTTGSSSSNNNNNTDTTTSSCCYGQHEFIPIVAGSTLRGAVIVVISKSFRIPSSASSSASSSSSSSIVVQLHLYGKEKIQINSQLYPIKRHNPNHSTPTTISTTTTTTTTSSSFSLVSRWNQQQQQQQEYEFLNIPLQWDDFPTILHPTKTNRKKIRKGTYTFPFQIQLPYHIPSSMYHPAASSSSSNNNNNNNKNKSCRIQYKLRASIYFPKQQQQKQQQRRADYTTTRYIWVAATSTRSSGSSSSGTRTTPQENPEFEPVPCMIEPIVMELGRRNHRNKKGEFFMFGASIDNTRISKHIPIHEMNHLVGQRARTNNNNNNIALHISCRNNTSVAIQKVRVSFIERISWNTASIQYIHPQTGICTTTSPILQQTQDIPISTWDNIQLPTGFAKEYKGFIQSTIETLFGTITNNNNNNNNGYNKNQLQQFQREIYNDLVSRNNLIELNLLPTTTTASKHCVGPNHTIVTMDDNYTNNGTTTATTSSINQQTHMTSLIRETYSGRLIQISHFIRIVFVTTAGMNYTNFYFHPNKSPVLEIPIQIVPPPSTSSTTTTTVSSQSAPGTGSPSAVPSSTTCVYPTSYQPPKDTSTTSSSVLTTTAITGLETTNMNHTNNGGTHTTTSTQTTSNTSVPTNTTNNNHTNDIIPMATAVVLSNDFTTTTDTGSESASNVIVLNEDSIIQQHQPATTPVMIHRNNNGRHRRRGGGFWNRQNQKHPSLVPQQQQPTSSAASNLHDTTSRPEATAAVPSLSNLVPVPLPTKEFENTISIPALINSMRSSMNGYEYLHSKLCDPRYVDLFQQMSCHEYGTIVGTVQPFDQPRVAVLLAPFVNYTNGGLTCTYAACAIQNSHDHHRAITAQKLIPLCIDIEDHSMILLNELNGWEQTIVERTLADAIK